MLNREKIMHGLQCCAGITREYGCKVCDYYEKDNMECSDRLALEALELLKEQEKRIALLEKQEPKPVGKEIKPK